MSQIIDEISVQLGLLTLKDAELHRCQALLSAKIFYLKTLIADYYGLKFDDKEFAEVIEYLKSHDCSDFVDKYSLK